ncbi:sigma-70 RNA polymerase sigma factor region 4 domain-containing protein [Crocosphaera chwakensis]|uniref:Uncharacterized protein n=1 Tax=Crocosphaera chwakensis CCY0110 TaxID=391612 RepID=A3IZ33_9CHRO|nr:sigma-70 family RNA polymerase sigma factor [Crocosphaera chwakensis]EAZ88272.1 hypothetical protein CY0110_06644 [Crocosphaera chwakensis CCY0110]
MSLVYLEYTNRRNHLDSELSFLFKDTNLLSSLEQQKFYALMNHIDNCIKHYNVNDIEESDILAKIYQKALKTITKRPIYNPYGWVKKAVTWDVKDIGRKSWGKEPIEYNDELGETLLHSTETDAYTLIQMKKLIDLIFESLSDLDAEILVLKLVENQTWKKIHDNLVETHSYSLSYDAFRKHYRRLIKRIKENDTFQSIYQSLF